MVEKQEKGPTERFSLTVASVACLRRGKDWVLRKLGDAILRSLTHGDAQEGLLEEQESPA